MNKERIYICRECGVELTNQNKVYNRRLCKRCSTKISTNWRINHKEIFRTYLKRSDEKIRRLVISHYSNGKISCDICGENDINCLSINHINGEGRKERELVSKGKGGIPFYRWLIKNHYPKGYNVLCMNCQFRVFKKRMRINVIEKNKGKHFIYIAGPYTPKNCSLHDAAMKAQYNIDRAIEIANKLIEKGHYVFVPHLSHYIHIHYSHTKEYKEDLWYELDNTFLYNWATALFYIGSSYGADKELEIAKRMGLKIYYKIEDVPEC